MMRLIGLGGHSSSTCISHHKKLGNKLIHSIKLTTWTPIPHKNSYNICHFLQNTGIHTT